MIRQCLMGTSHCFRRDFACGNHHGWQRALGVAKLAAAGSKDTGEARVCARSRAGRRELVVGADAVCVFSNRTGNGLEEVQGLMQLLHDYVIDERTEILKTASGCRRLAAISTAGICAQLR